MKILKAHAISGLKWASLVVLSLVFLPPLLVGLLPVWADAQNLVAQDKRLIGLCKAPTNVELSRWLYSYKFSGESANAAFNGQVNGAECHNNFHVKLQKNALAWEITEISVD
jgi:hypothetical protein